MQFDGNEPDFIKRAVLEANVYEDAVPNDKAIKRYLTGIAILQNWQENGWCHFQADDVRITQKRHYVSIKWTSKVNDEMFKANEFAKFIEMFDEVTPNEGGKTEGIMSLCIALYNPTT